MIDFRSVSIHFGTQDVLKDTTFRVNRGERVGIVGPNGAGKSTIFELICGGLSPERGDVVIEGRPVIGHLRQQINPQESAGETLLEYAMRTSDRLDKLERDIRGIEHRLADGVDDEREKRQLLIRLGDMQDEFENAGGYDMETKVKSALCGLGFRAEEFGNPFPSFSGGWKMRAELARSLVTRPDVLLLDEPSNYLDVPAVEWMQRFLRDYQGTLMLISHDRYLLRALTNVTLEVDGCTITRYSGGLDFYLKTREQRYATLIAAKKNQDRIREQAQRFIDTFRYTPSKAAQVQSKIKSLEKMEIIEVPRQASTVGHIRLPEPDHCGTCVLRLKDVGFAYDGGGFIFRNLSFEIGRGEKIAVVGYNGLGKSTLSRLLAGMRAPTEGELVFGHNVRPGYVSQDFQEIISDDTTLLRVIRGADEALTESQARSLLGVFGFSGDDVFKTAGVLSGGEKIRLAFARLYACRPNVLVLDEPTTHLDLNGRTLLERLLKGYAGTVIVVSHDVEFIRAVAQNVLAFEPNHVIRKFPGGYDDYCAAVARERAAAGEEAEDASIDARDETERREKQRSKKELRKERAEERAKIAPRINDLKRRVAAAEERIAQLEAEQSELVAKLSGGEANIDFATVNKRLAEIQADLATVNALWEQSASELDILTAQ